jgi:predicted anti-sigma-YlaC factor YlaD
LDDEDGRAERAATDAHLAGCAACRQWFDRAAAVTRLARTGPAPEGVQVDEAVLAAVRPRRTRVTAVLRVLLGVLGMAQVLLGAAQIAGVGVASHLHGAGTATASAGHLWNESAAWNVAVGAGFVWIALRRTRPIGIVPTLTAFVGVLSLLSIDDVVGGRVDVARLLSHGIIFAGYVIVLLMSRPGADSGTPPAGRPDTGPRWRATFDTDPEVPAPARLRLVRSQTGHARGAGGWGRAA